MFFFTDEIKTEKQNLQYPLIKAMLNQKQKRVVISQQKCNPLLPKEGHHRMKTLIETTSDKIGRKNLNQKEMKSSIWKKEEEREALKNTQQCKGFTKLIKATY